MTGILGIQVLGATEVAQKFANLPRALEQAETRAVNRLAVRGEGVFKRNVSGPILKVRTGAYRASIGHTPAAKGPTGAIESRLGVRHGLASKYAPVHEFGAVIRPRTAPRLVFKIPNVGWRSALEVRIPARRPLGKSFEEIRPLMPGILDAEIKRAIGA